MTTRSGIPPASVVIVEQPTLGLLLPYQARWVADTARVKIAEKGRRTGFTFGEAADNVLSAASSREAAGRNVYYIGYNLEMAREYISACGRWALGLQYAASAIEEFVFDDFDEKTQSSKQIKAFRIDFPSGFYIQALSSRPRSLRGMQGDVVIDEAAFHDDFPGLLKAATALLIWGGRLRIISTHNGEDNPYNEVLKDCRAGRKSYSVHECKFDTAIAEGLARRIAEVTSQEWSPEWQAGFVKEIRDFYKPNDAEELDCIPSQSGGTYMSLALLEPCVNPDIPVIRLSFKTSFVDEPAHVRNAEVETLCREHIEPALARLNPDWPSFFGSDFGRTLDLTVMWPGQVAPNTKRTTAFVLELRNCPHEEQERIFIWVVDRLPRFSGGQMDARGNGSALAEAMRKKYGAVRIVQVMLTRPWYFLHWPLAKALVEGRDVDIPKDRDVQSDLRAVKVDRGVPLIPDRIVGSDENGRHGDAAIAYVLFAIASRMVIFAVGYEAVSGHPGDALEPRSGDRSRMRMRADDLDDDDFRDAERRATW